MNEFVLCTNLCEKGFIIDLPLSRVLLNDSKYIPWIFLVPRISDVVQITDLSLPQQMQLTKEINLSSNVMQSTFKCDRLNIASIGNKTSQLHVHVICRTFNDKYWPETVWQYTYDKMQDDELMERALLLKKRFEAIKF